MASRSSGTLYEHIALDMPVTMPDGQGGTIDGWEEQFQCRAKYRYLRGTETVMAARLEGKQPVIITVRASSETYAATTDWRIRDVRTGTEFAIHAIQRTDDRQFLEILAESGVAV